MSETPQHASYCGNASGPDPLCGGCGMSETPQSVLERYIRDGGIITLPHIREAVRAMLDLVRVQYAANEEMTRVLSSAEAELRRAEKLWGAAQERAEKMEAERDEARSDWVALVDEAASTEAERDALRAEVAQAEGVARGYMLAAEKAEAALREARWLAEHWPAFWIVGPRWTDAERYAKAIEAIEALRDTAPRRSSHDA